MERHLRQGLFVLVLALSCGPTPPPLPMHSFTLETPAQMVFAKTTQGYADATYGWDERDTSSPLFEPYSPPSVDMRVTSGWPLQLLVVDGDGFLRTSDATYSSHRTYDYVWGDAPWRPEELRYWAALYGPPGTPDSTWTENMADVDPKLVRYIQHGACSYRTPMSALLDTVHMQARGAVFSSSIAADTVALDSDYQVSFLRDSQDDRFANHDGFSIRLNVRLTGSLCVGPFCFHGESTTTGYGSYEIVMDPDGAPTIGVVSHGAAYFYKSDNWPDGEDVPGQLVNALANDFPKEFHAASLNTSFQDLRAKADVS